MNYRFRVSERQKNTPSLLPSKKRHYQFKGKDTLRQAREEAEKIRLFRLFELDELGEAEPAVRPKKTKRQKKQRPPRQKKHTTRRFFTVISTYAARLYARLRTRLKKIEKAPRTASLPIFAGALCAALLLSTISSGAVLLHLFGRYHAPYTAWTVPNFIGEDPESVLSRERASQKDELPWNLILQYADHAEIPAGCVISQSPPAGVARRIYRGTDYCNITLTVSHGLPTYELTDLTGKRQRDACLILQNHGIQATVREVASESAPKGTVLQTIPPAGTLLHQGDQVLLQISQGIATPTAAVPNLFGFTEAQASTLLRAKGFLVGNVSYQKSSLPAGTVIHQTPTASTVQSEGTLVSYTVSLGENISLRTVPELYGLSYADAVTRLREYGLVVGSLYSIANAAPRGTVIEQTPTAGTPITSATVSVDLYLSS